MERGGGDERTDPNPLGDGSEDGQRFLGYEIEVLEAGLEGLWSPVVKTNLAYCEYKCNMCTQVCPTEAIDVMGWEMAKLFPNIR